MVSQFVQEEQMMMMMRKKINSLLSINCCLHQIGQYLPPAGNIECPGIGLYTAGHETDCDKYYLCRNGTLTLEHCPNGLLYAVEGAVYEFCAHNWKVDCHGKSARK